MMKIYILLAHPNKNSFNGQIANQYERAAISNGHEVRRQDLGEMRFDPILWKGYAQVQELEPDLRQAWGNITWCDKWVIIYPVWWGSVPALLKGFIDRTLLPGAAFKYHTKDPFWDKQLSRKTAHVITTSDAPAIWLWWQYGNSDIKAIKKATLEFCGIKPVKTTRISRVKYLDSGDRQRKIARLLVSVL
ncbi:NAD(P)H-dependent oxidoreductase [Mucilaginibacter sp. CAU 1740]|uniref:NAD(P)H-dependent oxidoreductase n=1 Tax=Mucilaginibacter sp. CAU 1740 TaxID=3140365 RepID=UPI00325B97CC